MLPSEIATANSGGMSVSEVAGSESFEVSVTASFAPDGAFWASSDAGCVDEFVTRASSDEGLSAAREFAASSRGFGCSPFSAVAVVSGLSATALPGRSEFRTALACILSKGWFAGAFANG